MKSIKYLYLFPRYGYHITKNSYFICHDQEVIRSLFQRLRNHGDQKDSYPSECGGFSVTSVRDLTTGHDSSQPDNKAVRRGCTMRGSTQRFIRLEIWISEPLLRSCTYIVHLSLF